jgi:hypothetical protein
VADLEARGRARGVGGVCRGPQTHKYYKKLVEHIFPSRSGLRCYELYTLYLGVLSVKSITHYDRNLVAILLDRKNK